MKMQVESQDVRVSGDFKTSSYAIGDVAFIVDMLADKVYTDKEAAVVRELSCNAYDSHVMAGKKDVPFDVHLPTALEPFFSVRDYGTGLSDDDVRGIFAGIGISTKRNSNEVIGCFGIGSLSPYALVNSFTVKSWYNGSVSTYTCYRDANREPVVALLHTEDSDEANGVEVSFPTDSSSRQDFQRAAIKTFQHWEVLPNINSKSVVDECLSIQNSVIIQGDVYKVTNSGMNVAIMGNVAYSIPSELLRRWTCSHWYAGLVLKFDMGEVSFDAARENLSIDEKTSKAVAEKYKAFEADAKLNISTQIEAAVGKFNKWTLWNKFQNCSLLSNICSDIKVDRLSGKKFRVYTNSGSKISKKEADSFSRQWATEGIQIFLKEGNKDSAESRIKHHLSTNRDSRRALLVDQDLIDAYEIPSEFYKPVTSLPKPESVRGKMSGSKQRLYQFSYWCGTTREHWDLVEIDLSSQSVIYVSLKNLTSDISAVELNADRNLLKSLGVDVPPIIGVNSEVIKSKKFSKGGHVHFNSFFKEKINEIATSGTLYTCFDMEFLNRCKSLCSLNLYINQSDLRNLSGCEMRQKLDCALYHNNAVKACQRVGFTVTPPDDQEELVNSVKSFFDNYPMLKLAMSHGLIEVDTIKENLGMIAEYIGGTKK